MAKGGGGGGGAAQAAQEQVGLAREIRGESSGLRNLVLEELTAGLEDRPVFRETGTTRVQIGSRRVPVDPGFFLPQADTGQGGQIVVRPPSDAFREEPIFGSVPIVQQRPSLFGQTNSLGLQDVAAQFQAARRNILQGGSRGGQLQSALTNLEMGRAATAAGVRTDNLRQAFNLASALGSGNTALAFQGLASGSSTLAGIQQSQQALQAQQQAALGQGIGATVGKLGAAAILASDRVLKRLIHKLADDIRGFAWYAFEYLAEPGRRYVGVMAQELLSCMPDAVSV